MMGKGISSSVLAVLVALGLVVLTGCGTTMRDLPIPGTGVSGDTVEVQAEFAEALNLAVGAPVKVNGVDMGKVKEIEVEDFTARATLTLKEDSRLREGARARLRYTTPLGELFVDVTNPASGKELADGALLEMKDTDTAPTVEDALSQASLLINGGGLEQLQTVTEELNTALNGNEGDYRALLDKAAVFLTQANATTSSIDAVLTSLNSLSGTLNTRKDTINRALRDIRPAAKVLREKTPQFTELLAEVEKFTGAANSTVQATRSQLLSLLKQVEPVLAEFAKNNGVFDTSLQAVLKAAAAADEAIATDYLNISLELHLDNLVVGGSVTDLLKNLLDLVGLGDLLKGLPILGGLSNSAKSAGTPSTKSGGGTGAGTKATDPLGLAGLTGLLGNLLGGGSR